jgi:hypothetical protein
MFFKCFFFFPRSSERQTKAQDRTDVRTIRESQIGELSIYIYYDDTLGAGDANAPAGAQAGRVNPPGGAHPAEDV